MDGTIYNIRTKRSHKFKSLFFAIVFLFVVFADELFFSYLTIMGISVASGLRALVAIGLSLAGYSILVIDLIKGRYKYKNFKQARNLGVIILLYLLTGMIYKPSIHDYWAQLFVFLSMCIPAYIIGTHYAFRLDMEYINKLLPYFISICGIIVFTRVIFYYMLGTIIHDDEGGLNYQNASYYLAFMNSYSIYYLVFKKKSTHMRLWSRIEYVLMVVMFFITFLGCMLGGGRGAFVYMILAVCYTILRWLKLNKGRTATTRLILISTISIIVLALLLQHYNVFESSGFLRVTENLTEDSNRTELWMKVWDIFTSSPLFGKGLGSIWWTVGFYSHNIFTDIIAEAGIIGIAIFLYTMRKTYRTLMINYKFEVNQIFVQFVLLGACTELLFSGYWLTSYKLFLVLGIALSQSVLYKSNQKQTTNVTKTSVYME